MSYFHFGPAFDKWPFNMMRVWLIKAILGLQTYVCNQKEKRANLYLQFEKFLVWTLAQSRLNAYPLGDLRVSSLERGSCSSKKVRILRVQWEELFIRREGVLSSQKQQMSTTFSHWLPSTYIHISYIPF